MIAYASRHLAAVAVLAVGILATVRGGRTVLLEPGEWVGKPCEILEQIDIGKELQSGSWALLLYHDACPECTEAMERLAAQTARLEDPPCLAFIAVPPFGPGDARDIPGDALRGALAADRDWVVATPVILRLSDGVVRSVELPKQEQGKTAAGKPGAAPRRATSGVSSGSQIVKDLGYIQPDSTHKLSVSIPNPLPRPLRIVKIVSECSCTKVTKSPQTIAPGRSGVLQLTFKAFSTRQAYAKRVILLTDSDALPTVAVTVRARIGLPLRIQPPVLDFGTVAPGRTHETTVTFKSDGEKPVRILYGTSRIRGLVLLAPRDVLEPHGSLCVKVKLTLDAAAAAGPRRGSLHVRTNSPEQRSLALAVRFVVPERE